MREIRRIKRYIRILAVIFLLSAFGACGRAWISEDTPSDISTYSLSEAEDMASMQVYNEKSEPDSVDENELTDTESNTDVVVTADDDVALTIEENVSPVQAEDIPEYSSEDVISINKNEPFFTDADHEMKAGTIRLSPLDELGRCGAAMMVAGPETLPQEERGEIGMIKPSGWHSVKYPDLIEDIYLYNRSHLLAHQLSSLNAEKENLITGTRYFNATLMLKYENIIADYIHDTGNHVLYRVTPVFQGDELVARGVLMEAWSEEDAGVEFCVFCYNTQPGIEIDYATGDSRKAI